MAYLVLLLIFMILASVIGWHIIFTLLGGVIVIGTMVWALTVFSIALFGIMTLLSYFWLVPGMVVTGLAFMVWGLFITSFFPIIFPVVFPLFIIYVFLGLTRHYH